MDFTNLFISIVIGCIGGIFGGLFGVGGGIVIIPLLTLAQGSNPQLYQAASLVAAFLVSLGSIPAHMRAKAIQWDFAWRTIPVSICAVAIGVMISNNISSPVVLERIFAAFLLYVAVAEGWARFKPSPHASSPQSAEQQTRTGWKPAVIVGSLMGGLAGLLGIGGGVIAVPLMRSVNGFSLRATIATSAFMILPTVIAGALLKFSTLSRVVDPQGNPLTMTTALWLAAALAPGAYFGARMGATLVHKISPRHLAVAFTLLCVALSIRMLGFSR